MTATKKRRNRPRHETIAYSIYLPPDLAEAFEACLARQRALRPDIGLTANAMFKTFIRAGLASMAAGEEGAAPATAGEDAEAPADTTGEV